MQAQKATALRKKAQAKQLTIKNLLLANNVKDLEVFN